MPQSLLENTTIRPAFVKNELRISTEWTEKGNSLKKDFEAYKKLIAETIAVNLKLVDELPSFKSIKKEDIKNRFSELIAKDLEKDEILEKSVEISKYSKSLNKFLHSYFSQIYSFHDKIREETTQDIMIACRLYFDSNLPIPFLKIYESGSLILKDYLNIYDKNIRQEQIKLVANVNNQRKFENLCAEHNSWIEPFNERLDKIRNAQVKLFWYIDLCNCSKIEEFDKPKFIDFKRIDAEIYDQLSKEITTLVNETNALLKPHIEFKPLLSYDDGSTRVLRNIMEVLQG